MVECSQDLASRVSELQELLSDSLFPYKVDLVEFSRFADSYKPGYLQERVLFPDASGPAVGI